MHSGVKYWEFLFCSVAVNNNKNQDEELTCFNKIYLSSPSPEPLSLSISRTISYKSKEQKILLQKMYVVLLTLDIGSLQCDKSLLTETFWALAILCICKTCLEQTETIKLYSNEAQSHHCFYTMQHFANLIMIFRRYKFFYVTALSIWLIHTIRI